MPVLQYTKEAAAASGETATLPPALRRLRPRSSRLTASRSSSPPETPRPLHREVHVPLAGSAALRLTAAGAAPAGSPAHPVVLHRHPGPQPRRSPKSSQGQPTRYGRFWIWPGFGPLGRSASRCASKIILPLVYTCPRIYCFGLR